jgi:signal transduction histidine kinase/HAMP domain-containing protein
VFGDSARSGCKQDDAAVLTRFPAGWGLSTRLAAAMISLVLLTAFAIGVLSFYNVEQAVLPRALARYDIEVELLASRLRESVSPARADVLVLRSIIGLDEVMAEKRDSNDRIAGLTQDEWRARIARRISAELREKPAYFQVLIIGAADGGREIVRVDRAGPNGSIRIVPDGELTQVGDRDYFRHAVGLAAGQVDMAPVLLKEERASVESPPVPVLRVATPLHDADGRPLGLIVINVDMRPFFDQLRNSRQESARFYALDEQGNYLAHPDRTREFGFAQGRSFRAQSDFPELASMLAEDNPKPRLLSDANGERYGVALASVDLANGRKIGLLKTVPYDAMLPSTGVVRSASLAAGLGAVLLAIVLALVMSRSLTRPLTQMISAIDGFRHGATTAVPTGAGGEIGLLAQAFQEMAKDVTEKSAALQRNAEIFDTIMTSMSDAVLLVDQDTRVVFANPAAKAMLPSRGETGWGKWGEGYKLYDSSGLTPIAADQLPILRAARGEVLNNIEVAFHEGASDKLQHHIVSARPILGADREPRGAVMVVRDITQNKETERQLGQSQKMDAIGQLTGGVAHDFNNILTVIIGTIEILAEGVADRPQLAAIAQMIDEAATRGADLTNHLLAFARKQPLQPRATDVNALIVDTARLLRPTLGEQIEIEAMLPDDAWRAMIDPVQLSTAIINLAVNARDAMPNGGKLTLETGNVTLDEAYAKANGDVTPGPYVMIAVSDTGAGIPAAIRDRVFEPFFTTKEVGKGTGLGLSMVYGFVKQSHGHIKIYSEEGHGSSIKLYLPRLEGVTAATGGAVQTQALPGGQERILVVEDDGMVRNYVIAQLSSLGYQTLSAANALEALGLLDQGEAFELLFTDVIMPGGLNGRQLADEVLRRRPSVKVLFTSGYTENAIVHHGRLDHGVALLNKPYRKADLARKIREVFSASPPIA